MSKKTKERAARRSVDEGLQIGIGGGGAVDFAALRRLERARQADQFPFFSLIENEVENRFARNYLLPTVTALPWTITDHPTSQFIIDRRVSSKSPYFINVVAHRRPIELGESPQKEALPERIELVLLVYSSTDPYSAPNIRAYQAFQESEDFVAVPLPSTEQFNAKISQVGQELPLRSQLIFIDIANGQPSINQSFRRNFPILEHALQPVVERQSQVKAEVVADPPILPSVVAQVVTDTTELLEPAITAAMAHENGQLTPRHKDRPPRKPEDSFALRPGEIAFYAKYCDQLRKAFPNATVSEITNQYFFEGAMLLSTITMTEQIAGAPRSVTLIILNVRVARSYDDFLAAAARHLKQHAEKDFTLNQIKSYFIKLNAPVMVVRDVEKAPDYLIPVITSAFRSAAKNNRIATTGEEMKDRVVPPPVDKNPPNPFLLADEASSLGYLENVQSALPDTMTIGPLRKVYFFDRKVAFNIFDVTETLGSGTETITVLLISNKAASNYSDFIRNLARHLEEVGTKIDENQLQHFFDENKLPVIIAQLTGKAHASVIKRIVVTIAAKAALPEKEKLNLIVASNELVTTTPEERLCAQLQAEFPEYEIVDSHHRTEFGVDVFAVIFKSADGQIFTLMLHDGKDKYRSMIQFLEFVTESGSYTKTKEEFYGHLSTNSIYFAIHPIAKLNAFTLENLKNTMTRAFGYTQDRVITIENATLESTDLVTDTVEPPEKAAVLQKRFLEMLTHFGFTIGWEADRDTSEAVGTVELYDGCFCPSIKVHVGEKAFTIFLIEPTLTDGKVLTEQSLIEWLARVTGNTASKIREHSQKFSLLLLSGSTEQLSTDSIRLLLYVIDTFGTQQKAKN